MKTTKRHSASDSSRVSARIPSASKLNMSLWFRLMGIFLMLNLVYLISSAVIVYVYAERTAASVVANIIDHGSIGAESAELLDAVGVRVALLDREPSGWIPSNVLRWALPEQTANAHRRFELGEDTDSPLWRRVYFMSFRIEQLVNDSPYAVVVTLTPVVRGLVIIFLILLIAQFWASVNSYLENGHVIRDSLSPVVELAEKAQNLSTHKGPYSPEEIHALAGKLEGIDAARLDTRIEVDDTRDELKDVAAAINNMLDRIRDSYRAQARFVSDASHELRTPIAAIQGYVNLLDRWGKNDPQALQESIDAIKEEAANMKELVEQLLFLARSDNHTMALSEERFDLAALAETVLRETQMMDHSHEYESHLSPVCVFADATLIKQALRILIDNAIKYTPEGGHIVVSTALSRGKARLTVQDDGIGIAPEAVPRIFDRFFRADDSRARKSGGTGLGLSIAKWIVERHGGHVEVLSRQDIGTRISIVIPALTEQSDG
jgi:two-component system sensor histidine kinase ArlS